MKLHFIRPEDRRRSGGNGTGPGHGTEWADTEPGCFRSEAFAEDLLHGDTGSASTGAVRGFVPGRLLRRSQGWAPAVGLALVAALGLRLGVGG